MGLKVDVYGGNNIGIQKRYRFTGLKVNIYGKTLTFSGFTER